MSRITKDSSVAAILQECPSTRRIFDQYGLKGCGSGPGPVEPLEFFAQVHNADLATLLRQLNREVESPLQGFEAYREQLSDVLYRRFFKAGVAVVLSIGCFWGAVNLFEIGMSGSFLQVGMLPAIYAHANAMIYGFVLLFVMGFVYQAVPRFKNTVLWRPALANLSWFLLLGGILIRAAAELQRSGAIAYWLGAVSGAAQLGAVTLFLVILRRTAEGSPTKERAPHEKFLAAAFIWLLLGTVLNEVFFFARLGAATERDMIRRIALIDGPLRDIQLLGFAAFIIAGISQRLLPAVYGLKSSGRDQSRQIFWLMNFSLVLNMVSYVLLYSTHRPIFVVGLQTAYLLMPVWAILLVRQIGIFNKPERRDRSFKFVCAAYIWLLVSTLMMPLFLLYGRLTQQTFAHSYMGAHRHAFTVGFISLMIVGVSSRVVPILAGVDAAFLTSLRGPFVLLNAGNVARVSLQILTDFVPQVAYPLVGFTGFIEVVGLAWWGLHLWQTMKKGTVAVTPKLTTISPAPAA